jgi:hypothetical protein
MNRHLPRLNCSLAQANLGHLVAHSYVVGLLGHDMMYSLLHRLRQRFTEADVTLMVGGG